MSPLHGIAFMIAIVVCAYLVFALFRPEGF